MVYNIKFSRSGYPWETWCGCTLWPLGITTALGWAYIWSVTSCQHPYIHYIEEVRLSEVWRFVLVPPFSKQGVRLLLHLWRHNHSRVRSSPSHRLVATHVGCHFSVAALSFLSSWASLSRQLTPRTGVNICPFESSSDRKSYLKLHGDR